MNQFERITKKQSFKVFTIFLLFFSLLSSSLPGQIAIAENGPDVVDGEYGSIFNEEAIDYERARVDKKVSFGENPGEYVIDLTIEGKDATQIDTTDIVLVYDNSNSMATNNRVEIARDATTQFIDGLLSGSGYFQMGLITYGSVVFDGRPNNALPISGNTPNFSYKGLTTDAATITALLPEDIPNNRGRGNDGGTFTQQGLEEAGNILASSSADNKIIVTITDGVPTFSYDANRGIIGSGTSYQEGSTNHGVGTIGEAERLMQPYELYTIAIEIDAGQGATLEEAQDLMRDISSSPDHAYFAQTVEQLVDHLNDIVRRLSNSIVDGSVEDPMGEYFNLKGSDNFAAASDAHLTDGSYYLSASDPVLLQGVNVSTDGQKINISGLNLGDDEQVTLRYKVQIDTEEDNFAADNLYRTNGETTLTPRGSLPNEKNTFPEPQASAKGIQVSGEKIWQDVGFEDNRPDEIGITLKRNDEEVDQLTVTPIGDVWEYQFPSQIAYDSQGNLISYSVEEVPVEGYKQEIDLNNQFNIINSASADISLVKEPNRDDLVVDEEIEYTFTIANTGTVPLQNIELTDTLEGLSPIEFITHNDDDIRHVDISTIVMQPEDELIATATYTITQEDLDNGQVFNTATVTGLSTMLDGTTVEDTDEVKVPQELEPTISLAKSSDVNEITEVGQEITYLFEIENTGNVTLTEVTLDDPMLGGNIELEKTKLYPGETTTVTVKYNVTQEDMDEGVIHNTAIVEGTPPESYDGNNPTDEDEDIIPSEQFVQTASIDLIKTGEISVDEEERQVVIYTFTVINTGNVTLKDIQVDDPMLDGEIELEKTVLASGESTIGTAAYVVTQADFDHGVIENTATTEGTPPDTYQGDNPTAEDEEIIELERTPAILLEKTSDVNVVSEIGQIIEYTFTVTNTGNMTLTDIHVNDPMLGGVIDIEETTLAPNESTTGIATYEVTQADLDRGEIINEAIVEGTPPTNYQGENPTDEDDDLVLVEQTPAILLEKVSDLDQVSQVGEQVIYTFTVTNTGNVTLTDVQVNDPMLAETIELETTTLAPGESTIGTATYTVTQADLDNGEIINEAIAEGTPPGFDPNDPSSPDKPTSEDDDQIMAEQNPAISLTKATDREGLVAGEDIIYTFTVENTGNVTLSNVTITDILDGISEVSYLTINGEPISLQGLISQNSPLMINYFNQLNIGNTSHLSILSTLTDITLKPGDVLVAEATYPILQGDVDKGEVVNEATVVGTSPKGVDVFATDEEKIEQEHSPAISLEKTSDVTEVTEAGQVIEYTFTVTNTGNVTLTDIEVDDPMITGAITLGTTTLAPGESTTGTAIYTVTQADMDNGEIINIASVTGTPPGFDPNDPDNPNNPSKPEDEDEVEIPAIQEPAISLEKTSDVTEVTEAGQVIEYTFTVTNTGNVTLTDIEVDDPMITGAITLGTTTLAPGELTTATATYTVTQADLDRGEVINIAKVTSKDPNDDPVTDQDEDVVQAKSVVTEAETDEVFAESLPKSATMMFTNLLIGGLLIIIGLVGWFTTRRQRERI